jgi:predicted nucleic acid-binding protein
MTPPFNLDTSALFAHCLEEPGSDTVESILEQFPGQARISAMTWLEFQVRLEEIHPDAKARREILACYAELLDDPEPVTKEVVSVAFDIRCQVGPRLPNADAIIAATAKLRAAALVHRDPHFTAIPEKILRQIVLPSRKTTAPLKKP